MIADTAVITKPSTSKVINSTLCPKWPTGGLVISFFDPCRGLRTRGLRSGTVSELTFAGLVVTCFNSCRGLRTRGLRSGTASELTFTGLSGVAGLFISKSIGNYNHINSTFRNRCCSNTEWYLILTYHSTIVKIFLVDVTAPFWRYGLGQCGANYFRSEAVQRDDA